jgi:hypothetical protein
MTHDNPLTQESGCGPPSPKKPDGPDDDAQLALPVGHPHSQVHLSNGLLCSRSLLIVKLNADLMNDASMGALYR